MAEKSLLLTDVLNMRPEEVAALPDDVIEQLSYGIRYWDPVAAGWTLTEQHETNLKILRERLWELEKRRDEELKRKLERVRRPRMVLCDCGHYVPEDQVLRAAFGTTCLDCYDRMEDYPPRREEADDA